MARYYVNISGVPQALLDFLGYFVLAEDEDFKVLEHKGDSHLIDKKSHICTSMTKTMLNF